MVTEFIFMAVSVSCRALLWCCKAMLSVLCRNVPSVLRSGTRKRFEGEEFELYLNIQLVPRSKHSVSVTQTSRLMLYREIIAVGSQIHIKHIITLCGQNVELLNVQLVVHVVTTGL
jgi:hypothetical protein